MYLINKKVTFIALLSLLLLPTACSVCDKTSVINTALVDIADGASIDCCVPSNAITVIKKGNGLQPFNSALTDYRVGSVIGSKCSDNQFQLPQPFCFVQQGNVVISPVSTLIVETVFVEGIAVVNSSNEFCTSLMSLSTTDPDIATTNIVKIPELDIFKKRAPLPAMSVMRFSLPMFTVLKSIEISVGSNNSNIATSSLSQGLADSMIPIDLTQIQTTQSRVVFSHTQIRRSSTKAITHIEVVNGTIPSSIPLMRNVKGDIT